FENVAAFVDHAFLFAVSELGADAGRGEESADAGTGGTDALGEVALRNELEFDLARAVEIVEDPRVALARKRAQDAAHLPLRQEGGEPGVTVARVVVDDGEVFRAVRDEGVNELDRLPGTPEPADHDGRAVR